MGAKAEIGWTRRTDEGVKLDVYVQHVGGQWRFFMREKRYDRWTPVPQPPIEDWMKLLDAVRRMIPRRRYPMAEEGRIRKMILDRFPGTKV